MTVFGATNPGANSAAFQVALAALLGGAGVYLLLPKPRGRNLAFGLFLALAGAATLAVFLLDHFGNADPQPIANGLFWFFSAGALTFGTVLVVQRNPARGAIAFAFVILSVCGLFLLLAAPFLMAVTVIVYAGAIIVTFLFVLMLSQTKGASNENDRTREPFLGALGGFAFAGLVLFALYTSRSGVETKDPLAAVVEAPSANKTLLPAPPLTPQDRVTLREIASSLGKITEATYDTPKKIVDATETSRVELDSVLNAMESRFGFLRQPGGEAPPPAQLTLRRIRDVRAQSRNVENTLTGTTKDSMVAVERLKESVRLLDGSAELPARNVANLGYLLYSEHLVVVELAGTLLLVATIGAVALSGRKVVPA
jgi:NADH:ubiquinone oxidoreductase subunit 6 (subunit J)